MTSVIKYYEGIDSVAVIGNYLPRRCGIATFIESMACGTPVIAFDRGSIPEIIENGKSGFLVNSVDEAIETVARIKEIDRVACRRHVERHFTVDRMVDKYLHVYEMIIRSNMTIV